ncbi:conjugal transfer protein TrbM [Yersinia aldovae]|uniref:TrbM/KikA/MpfK family conjugal transfer protein n=1 Tax=Yersinia aldovae TaxID=29483 RepID=UPI0005E13CFB|nr:TrbM/KikA/MpfK family conjugal transfer protein [Yersinia aldovae]CNK26692.1 conjugal transfer protein TrbM [Yersinia aldovae]
MKKLILTTALIFPFMSFSVLAADELSGDESSACKMLLCLSSSAGGSVSECIPPIRDYYAITAKKMVDTIKKRKNFLNLCPVSSQTPEMQQLVNDLGNTQGKCDAATLNTQLIESKQFVKTKNKNYTTYETKYRINNVMPSYCRALQQNQYTDFALKYVGVAEWQVATEFKSKPAGKWID